MAEGPDHLHSTPKQALPPIALPVIGASAVLVAAAWALTLATRERFASIVMDPLWTAGPLDTLLFVSLSGVMMVAMMLPSALPMVEAYRGIVNQEAGPRVALSGSLLFSLGYLAVWTLTTVLALGVLTAFGLVGALGGLAFYAPGVLLVAAGAYQFTSWKDFCLSHCRTPLSFLTTHYRPGARGALQMGFSHSLYCVGCCWLLMLVWFVAAAMSVLWMGVFAAFILAEKTSRRSAALTKVMGIVAVAAGALSLAVAASAPATM